MSSALKFPHILFTGPLSPGSVTSARVDALRELGHRVTLLDQRPYFRSSLWQKIQGRLLVGPAVSRYERHLIALSREARPDLLFIDCGIYLAPAAVRTLRASCGQVVHYTSDYFEYNAHIYRKLRQAAPYFSTHVITNSLNIDILRRWGAPEPVLTHFGYSPAEHFPVEPTAKQRAQFTADVAFAGHREPFYEAMLRALKRAGFTLRIAGSGWVGADFLAPEERVGQTSPEDYRAMIACAHTAPAFLSKWNRNTAGGRIFEIAAMGGCLVAERTQEQLGYFADGREADFFGTADELVTKVRRLVQDGANRRALAAAGHRRCLESGYTYRDRMRELIESVTATVPPA